MYNYSFINFSLKASAALNFNVWQFVISNLVNAIPSK